VHVYPVHTRRNPCCSFEPDYRVQLARAELVVARLTGLAHCGRSSGVCP
jgi:hypothetical protein